MNLRLDSENAFLQHSQPVILIGMHRSGTSLMARLLVDIGIHMGSWLSSDAEAVHFQKMNRRIYAATDSEWGQVNSLVRAMHDREFIVQQASHLRRALFRKMPLIKRTPVIARFFGPQLWAKICKGDPVAWGWKDPRTTLTFPIWSHVFPRARWVHVLRNGVDVAISVHRRSKKQQRKLRNHLFPLDYSPPTLDFDYCFHLWETYVSFVLEFKSLISTGAYLEIRYEELLQQPEDQLRRLVDFAGHPVEDGVLRAVCKQINKGRLNNSAYAVSYQDEIPALANRPLMHQLGYSYFLQPVRQVMQL